MVIKYLSRIISIFFLMGSSYSYSGDDMHFFLPDFPPYTTIDAAGHNIGIGLDKVTPILDSIGVKYTIRIGSNHGRALAELRNGRSDGFFMASRNDERDKYAVFSESVMTNRWVWVVLKNKNGSSSPTIYSGYIVASLLNTNTNKWLEKSGFKMTRPAEKIESLIRRLDTQEIDAVLVAEKVFHHHFKGNPNYKTILQEEKKFGIYISKAFLKQHPLFMGKLNGAIRARYTEEH